MNTEEWRPISGYEGFYEVSSCGRVRSLDRIQQVKCNGGGTHPRTFRGCLLKLKTDKYGYKTIGLMKLNQTTWITVHRLVGFAFLKASYFEGAQINHKNYDRCDNRVENLEWVTHAENIDHKNLRPCAYRGTRSVHAKLDDEKVRAIRAQLKNGMNTVELADLYGVTNVLIGLIRRRKIWNHVV